MAHGVEKRLTLTFEDVSIEADGLGEDYGPTVASAAMDLITWGKSRKSRRLILQGISGQVCPGEMLLVLGRPGSGCTSLLKILSNYRSEFKAVHGDVRYGDIGPKAAEQFRSQIVMNSEEDQHFPSITVDQTLAFSATTKLPGTRPEHLKDARTHVKSVTNEILTSLGISHTANTKVGNEFIRGVSGGERKRVSLAEIMATQAPLQCWDNSTRGLDASNALDFIKILRKSADEQRKTIVATLYQAGNGIYDQFDKVLVLSEGKEIYYGPRSEAKGYFENMGFICTPGANVADFLTACTVHTERQVAAGYEGLVPNSATEFAARYRESATYAQMCTGNASAEERQQIAGEVEGLKKARSYEKNRTIQSFSRSESPYSVSFYRQVVACTIRHLQIIWGDRWTNLLQIISSICMALVTGSLFYNLPNTSSAIFRLPGAIFYPIILNALNSLSEVQASFIGRPIATRQKRLAFARPAAFAIGTTLTDIPLAIALFSLFEVVYYFLVHFEYNARHFFTNWIILVATVLCLMSFFRMLGAWTKHFGIASQLGGFFLMVMMVYTGYLIPFSSQHVWFRWISWINPTSYSFQALLGAEMGDRIIRCVEPQYVPFGSTYEDLAYRSCTVSGARPGSDTIMGNEYISSQYHTSSAIVWRNFGIIIGFWIFFAAMTAVGFEVNLAMGRGSQVLFDRNARKREMALLEDTEKTVAEPKVAADSSSDDTDGEFGIHGTSNTFTFKDISYFVHHEGREKQLLRDVCGVVKPGQLVALMGSSGAGKTTLMDVLAQRKDSGRLEGSIMVNGRSQGTTFQRTTGYCEQNDVHEPTATVWEALLFSARLRQPYTIPDEEKKQYVEHIMNLLDLVPLRSAIIGSPGTGLSIEQRKRLTLATELVARPSLLFLDEPTSGLDGQSAFEICRMMRKLVAQGQTIICTIHQPSAALFEAFDVLLLLAKGGRTTYFGPTGKNSSILLDYFARHGAPCPENANPAEHIVDVVQGRQGGSTDWPEVWLSSEEYQTVLNELNESNAMTPLEKVNSKTQTHEDDEVASEFASPLRYQLLLVTCRQLVSLWRNPDYVWNKIGLHVSNAIFAGFTFWMIGSSTFDLQLRLMSIFNFVFVAPACINQMQPLFIRNRDIFETREKKSKTYHWFAFIAAQVVSEIPYLIACGTLYFVCWYFTSGFPLRSSASGQVYLEMLFYEFLYTSIGQAIAACSPNAYFAALANPLIIGAGLINFCGVVVPYSQIQAFWRYWLYYLDPFTYLIGGLLEPISWDVRVQCKPNELTHIPLPLNTTCGEYIADFLATNTGYISDPENTTMCSYCQYQTGADYMRTLNINNAYYGWRDVGITALFCCSSYALVFLMMKLRSKATKTAG